MISLLTQEICLLEHHVWRRVSHTKRFFLADFPSAWFWVSVIRVLLCPWGPPPMLTLTLLHGGAPEVGVTPGTLGGCP